MNKFNVRAREGYKFWEEVMQQYERSGLKRKAFCNKHKLDFNKFRNWRFRLKQGHKNKKKISHNRFIPLVMNEPATSKVNPNHSIELRLESSGNINICIPSQFNPEALGNLFSILRRTEC